VSDESPREFVAARRDRIVDRVCRSTPILYTILLLINGEAATIIYYAPRDQKRCNNDTTVDEREANANRRQMARMEGNTCAHAPQTHTHRKREIRDVLSAIARIRIYFIDTLR
jgi:hypothetical protein